MGARQDGEVPRSNVGTSHHCYINTSTANDVLAQLPGTAWRLLFALSRWGGIRVGSEPRKLTWRDVDWENRRLLVTSPKTERFAGRGQRMIPLFPELVTLLEKRIDEAQEGEDLVLPMLVGRTDASLRKPMLCAIERAGVEPWRRLWHNLRATRQTELEASYPSHVVCSWLGNTKATTEKHYLMVTDEHFEQAAQNAAQQSPADARNVPQSAIVGGA